jgi:hypothetical protein
VSPSDPDKGSFMRVDVIHPNEMFWKILAAAQKKSVPDLQMELKLRNPLGLDPGETTGCAQWQCVTLFDGAPGFFQIELFQWETKDIGQSWDTLQEYVSVKGQRPNHIRYEAYRVYEWKADTHSWSPVHTIQWIGAMRALFHVHQIPNSCLMAQHAKSFWTDQKLKACGLYSPGMQHARDACRHLLYYLTFPTQNAEIN